MNAWPECPVVSANDDTWLTDWHCCRRI